MPSAFPTDNELIAFLTGAGVFSASETSLAAILTGYASAAAQEFQARTLRIPFLKDATDVTRTYDPPGGDVSHFERSRNPVFVDQNSVAHVKRCGGGIELGLETGLLQLTSVVRDVTAATPLGKALTLGSDFYLLPANALVMNRPYTSIRFSRTWYGDPQSVQVTGKWGYSATVPDDVFKGVLALAAVAAGPAIGQAISKGMVKWVDGDTSEDYDDDPLGKDLDRWKAQADAVIRRYKLARI